MARMFERLGPVAKYDINPRHGHFDRSVVNGVDLAVICVPTPQSEDGSADISAVEEVVSWIDARWILLKSTVPPGTCNALSQRYSKNVHFSPEYMGEPRNFVAPWRTPDPRDAASHDFVIVGGPQATEILSVFSRVMAADARYVACTAVEAELAKYMENCYFAVKVTFCNEFAQIAKRFGVDYLRLRDLWAQDPRVNRDHTMVHPHAPFFDGKCLPKDLAAIIAASMDRNYSPELLIAVQEINDEKRREHDAL